MPISSIMSTIPSESIKQVIIDTVTQSRYQRVKFSKNSLKLKVKTLGEFRENLRSLSGEKIEKIFGDSVTSQIDKRDKISMNSSYLLQFFFLVIKSRLVFSSKTVSTTINRSELLAVKHFRVSQFRVNFK